MPQTISRTYPDAWVARLLPAIEERAKGIERHKLIQKLLQDRGVTPDEQGVYRIDELNVRQKAELIIDLNFWKMVQAYEMAVAEEAARAATAADFAANLQGGGS